VQLQQKQSTCCTTYSTTKRYKVSTCFHSGIRYFKRMQENSKTLPKEEFAFTKVLTETDMLCNGVNMLKN
jgi:hypothetical protein